MRKIARARSLENGIVFYSSTIPLFGVKAELSSNGKIRTSSVFTPFEDFIEGLNPIDMKIVKIIRIIVCALYFATSFILLDGGLITSAFFFTFFVSKKLIFLIYQAFCMHSKNGSKRSLGRFHAAEHMAVNAYNSLRRVPTLSEVKKYSKLSEHCGSMLMINDVVLYLNVCLVGILYSRFGFILGLVIAIISTLILVYATTKKAFIFLQNLVLTEATDIELQVAIDGLSQLSRLEEDYSENCDISTDTLRIIPIYIEIDE